MTDSSRFLPPFLFVLLLLMLPVPSAHGQDAVGLQLEEATRSVEASTHGPRAIHVTGDERFFPRDAEAWEKYRSARASGMLPLGKGAGSTPIGTEQEFNVRTNLLDQGSNDWITLTFTLRADNDVANVWVESSLTGDFSPENLEELEAFILTSTPEFSYSPDRGIIANDNDTFGDPPADPDGKVDILLHDIEEGDGNGCCVLGYVTNADLDPDPPPGEGNASNVLYVDLPDGMNQGGVVNIAGTIAHEYQHLIHFEYVDGTNELTFINEGMSEWAEVINGFFLRTIDYLQETSEHGQKLFNWRHGFSTSTIDKDYQRAGLFTTYIADRIGRVATGSVVQAKNEAGSFAVGSEGYDIVLQDSGLTFSGIVADFHAANFINDRTVAEKYGYSLSQREGVKAVPTIEIDGQVTPSPSTTSLNVPSGAGKFLSWKNVTDLELTLALSSTADSKTRDRTSFRIVAEPADGFTDVIDLLRTETSYTLPGVYDRVTLIVAHVKTAFSDPPPLAYDITGSWEAETVYETESVSYDSGENSDTLFFGLQEADMQANAFDVPANGILSTVSVAPVFLNYFNNTTVESNVTDFQIKIWADDGTGSPGQELYSRDESVTSSRISGLSYNFIEFDIPSDEPALAELPDRIYIGIANAGVDDNILVLSPAVHVQGEPSSYLNDVSAGGWIPLAEFDHDKFDKPMEGQAFPIRARFLVPTASEVASELPTEVALAQNYPNPFNPSTTIAYALPRPMHVRLSVYNALGQRVATVVDGMQQAGAHETRVDATGWASGVYLYALESEHRTLTQRMVVLK